MCKTIELRDQIALEAMRAAITASEGFYDPDVVARKAYTLADAMIAARTPSVAIEVKSSWLEHKGKTCPVPFGTNVDIKARSGEEHLGLTAGKGLAAPDYWLCDWTNMDIVAYRVVKP